MSKSSKWQKWPFYVFFSVKLCHEPGIIDLLAFSVKRSTFPYEVLRFVTYRYRSKPCIYMSFTCSVSSFQGSFCCFRVFPIICQNISFENVFCTEIKNARTLKNHDSENSQIVQHNMSPVPSSITLFYHIT